jgi:hypothetical protein
LRFLSHAGERGVSLAAPVLAAAFAFGLLSGAAPAPPRAWPDLDGIYWSESYSPIIKQSDGSEPPYTAAALVTAKKNAAAARTNSLADKARSVCTPDGVPRILASPYPFEIVEAPERGEVWLLYELNHVVRRVAMNEPLPSKDELETFPWYSGHSAGHWEGDTLVIETAGFNEQTFLDNSGAPHTDQLRTVERIRKIDGGRTLETVVTIHDPGVFTKDWTTRFVYRPRSDIRIMDYNCGEKHRDLTPVKGVQAR